MIPFSGKIVLKNKNLYAWINHGVKTVPGTLQQIWLEKHDFNLILFYKLKGHIIQVKGHNTA